MEAQDYVRALLAAGLTQVQIAEQTGIPQPTISKVFRGEVADVLSRNYRRLQDLYKKTRRKGIPSAMSAPKRNRKQEA